MRFGVRCESTHMLVWRLCVGVFVPRLGGLKKELGRSRSANGRVCERFLKSNSDSSSSRLSSRMCTVLFLSLSVVIVGTDDDACGLLSCVRVSVSDELLSE